MPDMPTVIRGSKLVLSILGVCFFISLIIFPINYSILIFSIVLGYYSWWWYKDKYRTLNFRRIGKPLIREKMSFKSDLEKLEENVPNFPNKNFNATGSGYSTNSNGDKTRKSDSRSLNYINTRSQATRLKNSFQESMSLDSPRKYKSVQTAAGPLLFHDNINDSYLQQDTSLMRDNNSFRNKSFDNRRNFR